jgi:hypothetical protein
MSILKECAVNGHLNGGILSFKTFTNSGLSQCSGPYFFSYFVHFPLLVNVLKERIPPL